MNKLSLVIFLLLASVVTVAQDSTRNKSKIAKKEAHRQKVNNLIRQAEEGVLVYKEQSIFGLQAKTDGYGIFYEMGIMKTNRKTNIYRIDITETKSPKEEKLLGSGFIFGNPFFFGKQNYFYPVKLGFGQQYMLGQKGNKNGVAVSVVYNAGLSLGLLRPYYINVNDPNNGGPRTIKYTEADKDLFLGPNITGGGGLGKGWNELKVKPGAFAKAAMRFDYGRFNETVSGLEFGFNAEYYGDKIPIMVLQQKDKRLFINAYISLLFGRRK